MSFFRLAARPHFGDVCQQCGRVWETSDGFVYPEQAAGLVKGKQTTGVAFSGGGNRAMVAAHGQLRALVETGLIDHVDYVSAVSGGSWASAAKR